MKKHSDLRIGTSGWSYPTGEGTWNGIFYPPKAPRSRAKSTAGAAKSGKTSGFDELAYYAERFDTVEVNTSFYRPPAPEMAKSWVARTPKNFEFSLKLYQKFTHPKMFKAAALKRAPGSEGELLEELATINQADVDQFKRALDPIASAGKLGALLAQFPPSFKADAASTDYLGWLLKTFRDYQVAVELRHATWSDDLGGTLALLNQTKAAFVQIDEPKFKLSIAQNFLPNVTGFYYLRLHGRNAKQWWKHDKSEDRYNYLYSNEELEPFVEIAGAVRALVKKLYLYANNHFAGKAVANANTIKERLGLPVDGDYPEEFVERYPQMKGIVRVATAPAEAAEPDEEEETAKVTSTRKRAAKTTKAVKKTSRAKSGSLFED